MKMLIGIDVGGTTTDAVIVDGNRVIKTAYVPTDHDNLLKCLLAALDELVAGVDTAKVERVVLSTTLITNMIAEGKTDPVALVLIPGPGRSWLLACREPISSWSTRSPASSTSPAGPSLPCSPPPLGTDTISAYGRCLKGAKIPAPIYILEEDSGNLPLDKSVGMPV